MERMEHEEIIDKPVHTVYNQWTQFEDFPRFMEGIKSVHQIDAKHLQWHAEIAGKDLEWEAEIIDQVPDQRIVWRSTTGVKHGGKVEFEPQGGDRTRVKLVMGYEPEGIVENIGDALGVADLRVKGDLKRFKEFIETAAAETGAWRGEVHRGEETTGNSPGKPWPFA